MKSIMPGWINTGGRGKGLLTRLDDVAVALRTWQSDLCSQSASTPVHDLEEEKKEAFSGCI